MARTTGPKCRLCRAEGERLFLKGLRCESPKCPFSDSGRLPMKPGAQFGQRRGRPTEYGKQLREKQKLKRFYGLFERQFRRTYKKASHLKGNVGENLLVLCERRLDNVICITGIASSRSQARQFLNHGFVFKNGKRIDIPSYMVSQGEEFEIKAKETVWAQIKENLLLAQNREKANWIDTTAFEKDHKITVASIPTREFVSVACNEQLVVELCSK